MKRMKFDKTFNPKPGDLIVYTNTQNRKHTWKYTGNGLGMYLYGDLEPEEDRKHFQDNVETEINPTSPDWSYAKEDKVLKLLKQVDLL